MLAYLLSSDLIFNNENDYDFSWIKIETGF